MKPWMMVEEAPALPLRLLELILDRDRLPAVGEQHRLDLLGDAIGGGRVIQRHPPGGGAGLREDRAGGRLRDVQPVERADLAVDHADDGDRGRLALSGSATSIVNGANVLSSVVMSVSRKIVSSLPRSPSAGTARVSITATFGWVRRASTIAASDS